MKLTYNSFNMCIEPSPKVQLRKTIRMAPKHGHIMEFGVFRGKTIRAIAKCVPNRIVYGFDSFVGLPESWKRTENDIYDKGHFKTQIPDVPHNVVIVKGFFEDTLPNWVKENSFQLVAFLHIDSDLYSSAITILYSLNELIKPGTIIVFDELCDWSNQHIYDFWEDGEWKSLHEWMEQFNRKVKPISRTKQFAAAMEVIQ